MTAAERSTVFRVLTSVPGYNENGFFITDSKKQIKWISEEDLIERIIKKILSKGFATEQFVKDYSDSIVYYFDENSFNGDGSKQNQFSIKSK